MVPSRGETELHPQMARRCPQGGADRDPADLTPSGPGRWGLPALAITPLKPLALAPMATWHCRARGCRNRGVGCSSDPSVPRLSCTAALLEFPGYPGGTPLTTRGWQHRPANPAATSRTPCRLVTCTNSLSADRLGQAGPPKPGVDEAWAQGPVASQMSGHNNGSLVPREREAQRPRHAPEGVGG